RRARATRTPTAIPLRGWAARAHELKALRPAARLLEKEAGLFVCSCSTSQGDPMAVTTIAAVRGAISVRANPASDIREAPARLLETMIRRNGVTADKVVSAVFTATPDLTADFPAHSARRLGWTDVPLLGAVELDVPGAPKRIVRVLLTLRGVPRGVRLIPVYLDEAAALRPDLAGEPGASARARMGPVQRIAIIGLGQIGGSIGLALEAAGGWRRVGFDLRAAVRREAHAK